MAGKKVLITILISLMMFSLVSAQRPPRGEGGRRGGDDDGEKFARLDANKNGTLELDELNADAELIFKNFDRDGDGALDETEVPRLPERGGMFAPPPRGEQFGDAPKQPKLPPPFMMRDENRDGKVTRTEFDENLKRHYALMDANGDGIIAREEFEQMREGDRRRESPPQSERFAPTAPTVQFLGAEMRFGDKLVKDAPFSAETVMENTRRLYDGSTVTTQNKGAIYRDAAGRTRREQPLETVGAFSLGDEAQRLIFIADANENTQYFLDAPRKIARKIPLSGNNRPPEPPEAGERKTESLGKKMLEGVSVEGTKTTIDIPAGSVGNDKPLQIVSERWFSPDLQTVVMSRHVDPLLGEQIFRLTNIRRTEPAKELFIVPTDYKIETDRKPR